jgi:hypothetical protein
MCLMFIALSVRIVNKKDLKRLLLRIEMKLISFPFHLFLRRKTVSCFKTSV